MFVDGEGATFDGKSSITYDISGDNQYVQTRSDRLKLRFLSDKQDGLLFYADSNQGDYLVLEMIRGRLYFHIDLGGYYLHALIQSVSEVEAIADVCRKFL